MDESQNGYESGNTQKGYKTVSEKVMKAGSLEQIFLFDLGKGKR
jgi:hypothetical protein